MNEGAQETRRRMWRAFCAAFFFVTVVLTICLTYYLSEYYLQGDISSDLVCANHLYETGRLVSNEWYGSTELRILRSEWVFAPLFALFDDWHLVRFVGTLVMQGIIVLAFGYLLMQIRADRNSFFLGASVLLVPYCFSYGTNVLYGCFYATFVSVSFFSVALMVSIFKDTCRCRVGKVIMLYMIGFVVSLGGPRILLNTAVPAVMLLLYMNVFENHMFTGRTKRIMYQACWIGIGYVLCALTGYVINNKCLIDVFSFSAASIELGFGIFNQLDEIMTSLLYAFGYQNRFLLASSRGLVTLACAGVCFVYFGWSVRNCVRVRGQELTGSDLGKIYICRFGLAVLLVMIAFKALTTDAHNNETYYLLISIWVIPWAAALLSAENNLNKRAAIVLILLVLYVSGLANILSFVFPERYKQHETVTFHYMDLPRRMEASCEFLEKEEFTHGYATFWYANVVTEMTDGKIRVAGTNALLGGDALLERFYWLTSEDVMNSVTDREFILLTLEEEEKISKNKSMNAVNRIYRDDFFAIYEILDPWNMQGNVIL